jgi:hypothetical protein
LFACHHSILSIHFAAYDDQEKLVKLAQFYHKDFSKLELLKLPYQLDMFVVDMRRDERFIKGEK